MSPIEYCAEEVSRQGHNIKDLDGIQRVSWMLAGWSYALRNQSRSFHFDDIVFLGKAIEPNKNQGGLRKCGVRVGSRICPDWENVPELLHRLLKYGTELSPLEFYKEFELIHPFVDGNGRTGKVLLNWRNGSLLDPIFPPNDLWGYPILNP